MIYLKKTEDKLVQAARKARKEIAAGKAKPMEMTKWEESLPMYP
jgi:hypothetical protein